MSMRCRDTTLWKLGSVWELRKHIYVDDDAEKRFT